MNTIKQRRLTELTLDSHPDLYVGQCVPFYFCPRSIMLYVIHRADSDELTYKGGQGPIIHLQADLTQPFNGLSSKGIAGHLHSQMQVRTTSKIETIWLSYISWIGLQFMRDSGKVVRKGSKPSF
ncbi:DarT ssDNA thymidine ADP-ribosyltransferase family protein [Salinivibrio socompensis]|uniref:DarT ssDNA thymidine ADP-ribosyltransferase family protein n=1 Tax=Salinivibrio socompensis TaxID=1510206 RepID=UPI0004AF772C|nr:DarT ssDNA thymidine ADP-ribosyltransferase family protein [Salinivibrio socompensis]